MEPSDVPGLPDGVSSVLRAAGIDALYPPQAAAVEAGVTDGESLVAAVPTASGKTLIAELAMLSAIVSDADPRRSPPGGSSVETDGMALYIVPLRALASEKRAEFDRWEEELGVTIGVSTGNYESSGEWLASRDIVVATSEKVDSLIRNDAPWIEALSCVVADEVHLVDDSHRGPTLEVTLAKLRRVNPDLQTVALSATVGNAGEIAAWLDAELVRSEWRPIELRTGVHFGNAINFDDGSQQSVPVGDGQRQTSAIVEDTLADDGSSLVFVNSRRNAESAARRMGSAVEPYLDSADRSRLETLADEIGDVSDTETSDDLAACVRRGAAFHHAGLASEHRSLIEDAFRDRELKVICATPTLAAGVNTPSRRVIVRDWRRYDAEYGGMKPLDVLEVHQMFGRAGRPGLDPYGEAVLLANSHDEQDELFERYVWAEPEAVRSKLAAEPALRTHVLSTIASGFATTREGLLAFLDGTLYATQAANLGDSGQLERVTDTVLSYLERNGFIEHDGETIAATSIGHTVSRLYLDPMSAAEIIDGLEAFESSEGSARAVPDPSRSAADIESDGFRPASELSGTNGSPTEPATTTNGGDSTANRPKEPIDEGSSGEESIGEGPTPLGLYHLVSRTPDMYELYLKSGEKESYTELCYEREPEFLGAVPSEFEDVRFESWLSALKTARLLEDWAMEVDEERITDRYGVGPGDVRGKVDTAEWLLGATERLAAELDLESIGAIRTARKRIEYGVRDELLDLAGVRGVGRKRARRLYEAGIETRTELRTADKAIVLGALRGRRKTAERILENAGRTDPSMDDVSAANVDRNGDTSRRRSEDGSDDGDGRGRDDDADRRNDQARLGDFG